MDIFIKLFILISHLIAIARKDQESLKVFYSTGSLLKVYENTLDLSEGCLVWFLDKFLPLNGYHYYPSYYNIMLKPHQDHQSAGFAAQYLHTLQSLLHQGSSQLSSYSSLSSPDINIIQITL